MNDESLRQFRESAAAVLSDGVVGLHHVAAELDAAAVCPDISWPNAAGAADAARAVAGAMRALAQTLREEC
jgi:hypothetical protein